MTGSLSAVLNAVRLDGLMRRTRGHPDVGIGLIDGPVHQAHPDLAQADLVPLTTSSCVSGAACDHGTFVAGMLFARRGSKAPALAPGCRAFLRPVFSGTDDGNNDTAHGLPATSSREVADAIRELLEAGVRLLHLSLAASNWRVDDAQPLRDAFDLAAARDALLVVATGNEGRLGAMPMLDERVVLPVAGCDSRLRPAPWSNLGPSIGRLGVLAPSEEIVSTAAGGGYTRMTGTSMAAPFVTGTAALLWSLLPSADAQTIRQAIVRSTGRPRRRLVPPLLDAEASYQLLKHRLLVNGQRSTKGSIMTLQETSSTPIANPAQLLRGDEALQTVRPAAADSPSAAESRSLHGTIPDHAPVLPADLSPQGCGCDSSGPVTRSFIYAIGSISAQFPNLGVEKEFLQAARDSNGASLTDRQLLHRVLSDVGHRYLARELCWVFSIEGLPTYLLEPRSDQELEQLIAALEPNGGVDIDVVVGTRGPLASPDRCNGLQLPIVLCDRIYTFDVEEFIEAIPRPEAVIEDSFANASRELFQRIQQLTDNLGEQDEHRAVNYLALRYPAIYTLALEMFAANKFLSSVQVQPSRLGQTRKVFQVILRFIDRQTDVPDNYFVRVDVADKWPYLVSKLQPFYDR